MDNPFEQYDLDPREGIAAITRRLKELAEDAKDDAERERIREAWEELTLHPARRLRAALFAPPDTRGSVGSPPPLPLQRRRGSATEGAELGLRELALRPSLVAALGPAALEAPTETERVPLLEEDAVLGAVPQDDQPR
jgi:hypothetical protein